MYVCRAADKDVLHTRRYTKVGTFSVCHSLLSSTYRIITAYTAGSLCCLSKFRFIPKMVFCFYVNQLPNSTKECFHKSHIQTKTGNYVHFQSQNSTAFVIQIWSNCNKYCSSNRIKNNSVSGLQIVFSPSGIEVICW